MPPIFEGSVQHKKRPSRWGPAACPCDKDHCPTDVSDAEVVAVLEPALQQAIAAGRHGLTMDGAFPRMVWGRSTFRTRSGGHVEIPWEARLSNRGTGSYKAWPVRPDRHHADMPPEVREYLWPEA